MGSDSYKAITRPSSQIKADSLVLAIRIKGLNAGTTP
jgi:hypothetical protein